MTDSKKDSALQEAAAKFGEEHKVLRGQFMGTAERLAWAFEAGAAWQRERDAKIAGAESMSCPIHGPLWCTCRGMTSVPPEARRELVNQINKLQLERKKEKKCITEMVVKQRMVTKS